MHSDRGKMLSLEVCPIGESSNYDPSHCHGGFDAIND